MKKVIVFRVEGVLVKDYDVFKMYDLKMRRLVKEMLKKEDVELKGDGWEEMKKEVEEWKKGFEEDGNVEKSLRMRDVVRRMEQM